MAGLEARRTSLDAARAARRSPKRAGEWLGTRANMKSWANFRWPRNRSGGIDPHPALTIFWPIDW